VQCVDTKKKNKFYIIYEMTNYNHHKFYKVDGHFTTIINKDDIDEEDLYKGCILMSTYGTYLRELKFLGELETYTISKKCCCPSDLHCCRIKKTEDDFLFSKNTIEYYFQKNKTYFFKTLSFTFFEAK
jgi:hypothetical protein